MTQAAVIELSPEVLAKLLRLPEGVVVTGVDQPIGLLGSVFLRVQGMGWEVNPGGPLQWARPIITTHHSPETEPHIVSVDWQCPLPEAVE